MVETVVTVERTTATQAPAAPASGGGGVSALRINIGYFKTVPGIIKLVQFVFGIVCMVLASPAHVSARIFFLLVAIISFIVTVIWIFAYLFSIREALNVAVNWILTIFGIVCMALASPAYISATSFFLFVVVISFIATVLWIFAYLLGIREALNVAVNWIFTELLNTGIATLLYFIAFVVQLAKWSSYPHSYGYGANIAAGVFGLFNFLAYAAGTYFLYLEHKNGSIK